MTHVLKALPFLAAFLAAPVLAAEPAPPAGHPPAAGAKPSEPAAPTGKSNPGAATHDCPMMNGKPTGGSDAAPGKTPDAKMKMDGMDRHCRPAAAKAPGTPDGHDHPEVTPK